MAKRAMIMLTRRTRARMMDFIGTEERLSG